MAFRHLTGFVTSSFCLKMVGLIITGAWVVLFQLTSQGSLLHAALYSVPGECRLCVNMELGMTYSNCCHLKCWPKGMCCKKIYVFFFIVLSATEGGIFLCFSFLFRVFPGLALIYLNPFKLFPLWKEIAEGLKQAGLKVYRDQLHLRSMRCSFSVELQGALLPHSLESVPLRVSKASERWIGYLI